MLQKANNVRAIITDVIVIIGLIAMTSTLYLLTTLEERRVSFGRKVWDQHPEIMQTLIDEVPICDFMTGVSVTISVCRVWLQVLLLLTMLLICLYFFLYLRTKKYL